MKNTSEMELRLQEGVIGDLRTQENYTSFSPVHEAITVVILAVNVEYISVFSMKDCIVRHVKKILIHDFRVSNVSSEKMELLEEVYALHKRKESIMNSMKTVKSKGRHLLTQQLTTLQEREDQIEVVLNEKIVNKRILEILQDHKSGYQADVQNILGPTKIDFYLEMGHFNVRGLYFGEGFQIKNTSQYDAILRITGHENDIELLPPPREGSLVQLLGVHQELYEVDVANSIVYAINITLEIEEGVTWAEAKEDIMEYIHVLLEFEEKLEERKVPNGEEG